jgi:hypothetical protein
MDRLLSTVCGDAARLHDMQLRGDKRVLASRVRRSVAEGKVSSASASTTSSRVQPAMMIELSFDQLRAIFGHDAWLVGEHLRHVSDMSAGPERHATNFKGR